MDAILQLDVDERIRIVQIIWDGIAASVDTMPLTVAEQATIEQLVAEDEAAPGDVVTWLERIAKARSTM